VPFFVSIFQIQIMKISPRILISLAILLFVNAIFSIKYLSRYTNWAVMIIVLLTGLYVFIFFFKNMKRFSFLQKGLIPIVVLYMLFSLYLVQRVSMETLNVDRWSIITSFWANYFSGKYVYLAKSHMGNKPGPMPFYFILALPFYFLKEFAYLSILGIVLFIYLLFKPIKQTSIGIFLLVFLLTSPIFLWETISRSAIFLNATLVLAFLIYLRTCNFSEIKSVILAAFLGGLLLSTRNVFALTFILAAGYYMKSKKISIKMAFIALLVMGLTFLFTFLPFIYGFWNEFLVINPFIIQSAVLVPFQYTLIFFAFAFYCIRFVKTEQDIVYYSAVVLFITICGYAPYVMYGYGYNFGFEGGFYGSAIDLSYFIFCLPFALYALVDNSENIENLKLLSGE
jgi:hypothetical protein